MTAPRPRAVVIGSLALFVVLFVVLTFELGASANTTSGKKQAAPRERPAPAEVEDEAVELGYEAAEPEYAEPEPEAVEIPPVVTSSS